MSERKWWWAPVAVLLMAGCYLKAKNDGFSTKGALLLTVVLPVGLFGVGLLVNAAIDRRSRSRAER